MTKADEAAIPGLPLFLDLRKKTCLVLGGEGEAGVKVKALLQAGARVVLLAETVSPGLASEATGGQFVWLKEKFRPEHLEGVWFVLSTVRDPDVNAAIQLEAERRRIFVNVVDQRRYCSALWPAVIHRDPVVVAFSTGGTSPALAGYLRRHIADHLPAGMGALATWLGGWRSRIARVIPDLEERGRFWRILLQEGIVDRFVAGNIDGAENIIEDKLRKLGMKCSGEEKIPNACVE